jgi:hypothetical protein
MIVAVFLTQILVISECFARPANFVGSYSILQTRLLALTNGRGYVLQDGALVAETRIDTSRPFCRAGQSTFDEVSGQVDVVFQAAADGSEHAVLTTIPSASTIQATTIDCIGPSSGPAAGGGFSGLLDISIALGRVVEVTR